jgi:hypothetical protein
MDIIGGNIFRDNIGAWLAATIVALMTVFSDKLLERIRFRLNRADLRAKYFEELAVDLSTYIFFAELFCERYQKGWTNDPDDLASIGEEVNEAVTTLRKKEFVYRSWVHRYWGDKTVAQFTEVMAAVKAVDDALHAFNDEGEEDRKTVALAKELDKLRAAATRWMVQTS